jgi:lipopolysaccharide transport system ATP-binding protein
MSDTVIQVDHVWKKFRKGELHDSLRELIPAIAKRVIGRGPRREDLADREFWALNDVSFEVKRGESMGIIGPNGAGKSTMLKLLSRIIKPNLGTYRVEGRVSALIEVGAGFHQDLTGRENIYLNGTILGMSRKDIRAKEEQIIDFAGVEEFIETPVKRYSSGMKARLGFAVAAHMEPDVLLVDEVLSVGDAKFRQKCISHMHTLLASDVTVIFISHWLDQVRSLCPSTLVLDRGKVIYHGSTEGAISTYLDALGNNSSTIGVQQGTCEAELRNIQLCNTDGQEVLGWESGQPTVIECDLVLHQPLKAFVQLNLDTIDGRYVGTANSDFASDEVPAQPGVHRVRFTFDPMPLAEGEYTLNLRVLGSDPKRYIWTTKQSRTISVRGGEATGAIIRMEGDWSLVDKSSLLPQHLET